ncbi:Uncharacterised protein [Yersinia aleksiciae]|uniref:Uncharacterized protein n=1 Tax=Yersinia aleksiciae TaxID=263819 RepID=A0A0T9V1R2_YERAE|nr:Uncharacterised protein [Yersinia aleksiciae]
MHFIAAVTAGIAGDAGDDHPFTKLCRYIVSGDFQFLTRPQCRRIGHPRKTRLIVQVAFMAQAGIKGPTFTFRFAPLAACGQVVIGVMIGFAVGGGITPSDVCPSRHIGSGGAVVVITRTDRFFNHLMSTG